MSQMDATQSPSSSPSATAVMSSRADEQVAISSSSTSVKATRPDDASRLVARWYFGGLASAGAAMCTHPLDLAKVHLQTSGQSHGGLLKSTLSIIRNQGVTALYSGLTASLMRQLTYSTTRFAIYEVAKQQLDKESSGQGIPFYQKMGCAAIAGAAGGLVGTPADMINVRMQNDIKLPKEIRRNYKHAIDGLNKVYTQEGAARLFNGATTATSRAILMTIGQLSMYDQYKYLLLVRTNGMFKDGLVTHFTASLLAGASATTITQPLDVMKTRMMNAKPGEYRGIGHCAGVIFKEKGSLGFFKGYVPAFVRLAPQTILTFIFYEQLRMNFGKKTWS